MKLISYLKNPNSRIIPAPSISAQHKQLNYLILFICGPSTASVFIFHFDFLQLLNSIMYKYWH